MEDNCFTVLCWFLPNVHMNQQWLYVCPSLVNLPPHSHSSPLLCVVTEHRIWAPWVIQQIFSGYLILHTVMYMFQRYSLSSSHPLLPLLCPQVWPLCIADTLLRKKKDTDDINFNNVFYSMYYAQKYEKLLRRSWTSLFSVFKIWCVFYTWGTLQYKC